MKFWSFYKFYILFSMSDDFNNKQKKVKQSVQRSNKIVFCYISSSLISYYGKESEIGVEIKIKYMDWKYIYKI